MKISQILYKYEISQPLSHYFSECECLGNVRGNGVANPLLGDGICHDQAKHIGCSYDKARTTQEMDV